MTCIPKNAWKRKDAVDGLQGLNLELLAGTQICFPGDPVVKNPLPMQDTSHGFDPWVKKIPWRRKWQPTCLGNPMDRGAWWATVHRSQRVRHDFGAKQQHRFAKAPAVKLCSDRSKLRTFSCMFLHSLSHNVSGAPRHRAYSHNGAWTGSELPSSRRTEATLQRGRALSTFLRHPDLLEFLSWIFSLPQHRPCLVLDLRPILNGDRKQPGCPCALDHLYTTIQMA